MQIILGSDDSGSVKEMRRLFQPVLRNVSLKKSLNMQSACQSQFRNSYSCLSEISDHVII